MATTIQVLPDMYGAAVNIEQVIEPQMNTVRNNFEM